MNKRDIKFTPLKPVDPNKHPKDMTTEELLIWSASLTPEESAKWEKESKQIMADNPMGRERFDEVLKRAARPKE